ncbi:MAG: EAL domain-containing protein, partial [Rhizobacter sp.]
GRARLAAFPVVDARGLVVHLESPLRVQLEANGPFEIAAHWLPLAVRSRLTCEADARAVAMALEAIARDGQPRGVNIAPASLHDSGFASRLRAQLQAAPRAARSLWVEVDESAAVEQFDVVREFARQIRPTGARVGLEHAGERLSRIDRLFEAGLDYVKLSAAVVHGVAGDTQRAVFVKGLATMLHSLSLLVVAEGVDSEADANALWTCGMDAITGPIVKMPSGS